MLHSRASHTLTAKPLRKEYEIIRLPTPNSNYFLHREAKAFK